MLGLYIFLFQSFFCELVIDLHTEQSNHNYLLLYTLNPPITTIYCFIYHSPCSLFPCQIFYLLSLCVYSVFSLLHICSEESKLTIKLNFCHKKQKMACQPIEKAKPKHRKGLWSPEEDNKLRNYILKHGHGCWSAVPIKAGEFLFLFPHYVPLSFILIAYSWYVPSKGALFLCHHVIQLRLPWFSWTNVYLFFHLIKCAYLD